ncbi:3-hydroxybutyryl-CoA dehydratase [Brevibacillus choshinensis]|uniref:3-hydroxybutyryl-CoA dehydratase n=1 Tax=Brevibacillus choshinensis TaxID=54911 RepID=A0ABR5N9Y1_BRECH|nr:enoyl-CoA hydratase/isomerase family protein [Brevibacillus choshinensis]KQL48362.1 3-hydroxybutyryl-CoA dehydratase [Brevibacillus choshinensis]
MRVHIKRVPDGKITLQETSKVAIITINRPAARNALTANMWLELARIGRLAGSSSKAKVILLRGTPGQFTAGADIKEFCEMTIEEAEQAFLQMEEAISVFESVPMPVIAAVDGPAMGAGFILSLACDMRIGTLNTRMGIPVGKLGITVGPSFMRRIIRLIGPSRATELVYTGKLIEAEEAMRLGLLNQLITSEELDKAALKLAGIVMEQSGATLRAVKRAAQHCEWKQEEPWSFVDPVDFPEGCLAFAQKRKPKFSTRV